MRHSNISGAYTRRRLRCEQLDERLLLSISPGVPSVLDDVELTRASGASANLLGQYSAESAAFQFTDISGTGAAVLQVIDDATYALTDTLLGDFEFSYYGVAYNELYISSNGLLTFGAANEEHNNTELSVSPEQAAIAVLWDDLINPAPATVYWQVLGTGAEESLVVQWQNVNYYEENGSPDQIAFQAVLHESTGRIELSYLDLTGGSALNDEGLSATVGIKGAGFDEESRLTLSYNNGPNIFVGSGKSVVIDYSSDGAAVVGRHVFYNNSTFDGESGVADSADDPAIAADKQALLPGGSASFANYTSYSKGLSGVMIDIANRPDTTLTSDDFEFRVGNSDDVASWEFLSTLPEVTVRPTDGVNASDRVTLVWPDGAVAKQWLQVTMKANANTGLLVPDVFYFGNAIADAGQNADNAFVNATDEVDARVNARSFDNLAPVGDRYDYNRDGFVNATDQILARSNSTTVATALRLIHPPANLRSIVAAETDRADDIAAGLLIFAQPAAAMPSLQARRAAVDVRAVATVFDELRLAGMILAAPPLRGLLLLGEELSPQPGDEFCELLTRLLLDGDIMF